MTQTEHYELNRIEPGDLFDLSALNDNMDAIGAALYELSQRPGGTAMTDNTSAVPELLSVGRYIATNTGDI